MCTNIENKQIGTDLSYQDRYHPKYEIVSKVAYMIGVKKTNFEDEHEPPQIDIFDELEKDRCARRIRNLCMLRTAFLKNYGKIVLEFRNSYKNITSIPDLVPAECVSQLSEDGIDIYQGKPNITDYIVKLNQRICDNINNCKNLFPVWLNWEYIKDIFIMPGGFKPNGIKSEWQTYTMDWSKYPYQCYINWKGDFNGNILYADNKFVALLYDANEDYFGDMSLVKDVGDVALNDIKEFFDNSNRSILVVDCENSDPIRLAAALSCLSKDEVVKVQKIFLFDSEYTTASWEVVSKDWNILSTVGKFEIEHIVVPRLNTHKSQVDMTLATVTCKEVYGNNIDSVVLVSSDSDYWALIRNLADTRFFVMVERAKCGNNIKQALVASNIKYCYLDDFCTAETYSIKITALRKYIQKELDSAVNININSLLDTAIKATWVRMTEDEKKSFYERYLTKIKVEIADTGDIRIKLGE